MKFFDEEFFETKETNETYEAPKLTDIPKPQENKEYLDQHIMGQDDAKKILGCCCI